MFVWRKGECMSIVSMNCSVCDGSTKSSFMDEETDVGVAMSISSKGKPW